MTLTEVGVDEILEWLVALGPAAFIGSILAAGWLFSAIRSIGLDTKQGFKPDLDREWLVRMSAILLKPAVIWFLLVLITLVTLVYVTGAAIDQSSGKLSWSSYFATGEVLSGLVAALAGKSGSTVMGYVRKWLSLETVIAVAVAIFILLALLAGGFSFSNPGSRRRPLSWSAGANARPTWRLGRRCSDTSSSSGSCSCGWSAWATSSTSTASR